MSKDTKKVILKTSPVDMLYSALFMALQYLRMLEDIDECVDTIGKTIAEEFKEKSLGAKSIKGYMLATRTGAVKNILSDIKNLVNQLEETENKDKVSEQFIQTAKMVGVEVIYAIEKHQQALDEVATMREV